jgi:hypothetical protein
MIADFRFEISDWIFHATYSKTSAHSDYSSHSGRFLPIGLCRSSLHTLDRDYSHADFNRHAAVHRHAAELAVISANFHARANELTDGDGHAHRDGHAACATP